MTFGTITQEDRDKAKATKQAKIDWASENLFTDFEEDEKRWRELASQYGVRLPSWYIANEPKYIKRMIKALGVDQEEYLEDCGCKTIKQLVQMNPSWPAYAEVGLLLEYWEENK